ncbi:hypothetical protein K440DRAFT_638900 [Wilcoxina mikolae CBS 423.85]|nr:hypothetical protein K440DRAFT_638900 [Wilcoxina mikolae CBS 423.85]
MYGSAERIGLVIPISLFFLNISSQQQYYMISGLWGTGEIPHTKHQPYTPSSLYRTYYFNLASEPNIKLVVLLHEENTSALIPRVGKTHAEPMVYNRNKNVCGGN